MGVLLGALLITGNPFSAILYTWWTTVHRFRCRSRWYEGDRILSFYCWYSWKSCRTRYPSTGRLGGSVCHHASRALVGTWFSGLIVFFDDYVNCLIVGSSMRPITDRLQVSRAKLAYLVDSTAAPVATLALISTWVGYEVSLMDEAMKTLSPEVLAQAGLEEMSAYALFYKGSLSIFTPFSLLFFGFVLAVSVRDFGPMENLNSKHSR